VIRAQHEAPAHPPAPGDAVGPARIMEVGLEAAIGFRVKSGWAAAVLLAGPAAAPAVIERRRVELSDPAVPASRQPHHAATGVARTDPAELERLSALVERCAREAVPPLLARWRDAGYDLLGAGLVIGSDAVPERIANPHIRAHAAEGRLFHRVLEQAVAAAGVPCSAVVERVLYQTLAAAAGQSPAVVKRAVAGLPREPAAPWRSDQKAAAAAAWLVLVTAKTPARPEWPS